MPNRHLARLLVLLLAIAAAGCAGLVTRPEPPRVTLSDFALTDVKLLEQKYRLVLRVQNPNAFPIALEGMDYEVFVNGKPFGNGVSHKPVTIPAYGTDVVEVEAYSTVGSVVQQLLALARGEAQTFRYRLRGHVRLVRPALRLPFDHEAELTLSPPRPAIPA